LVPAKRRWCSAAGKVTAGLAESNVSLPPGGCSGPNDGYRVWEACPLPLLMDSHKISWCVQSGVTSLNFGEISDNPVTACNRWRWHVCRSDMCMTSILTWAVFSYLSLHRLITFDCDLGRVRPLRTAAAVAVERDGVARSIITGAVARHHWIGLAYRSDNTRRRSPRGNAFS